MFEEKILTTIMAKNIKNPFIFSFQDQEVMSASRSVPEYADVVVVGGGSLGCNTLYHLAKLGTTNTVLLEAHKLTAGVCVCVCLPCCICAVTVYWI